MTAPFRVYLSRRSECQESRRTSIENTRVALPIMYCMSHCRFSRLLLPPLDAVGFLATRVALGVREAIKMTINSGGHKPALHFANGGERARAAQRALGSRACVCIEEGGEGGEKCWIVRCSNVGRTDGRTSDIHSRPFEPVPRRARGRESEREREGVYHKTRGKGRARAVRSFVLRCCKFRSRLEHFSAARGLRNARVPSGTDRRTDVVSFNLLIGMTELPMKLETIETTALTR